jgi:hypothetical protein
VDESTAQGISSLQSGGSAVLEGVAVGVADGVVEEVVNVDVAEVDVPVAVVVDTCELLVGQTVAAAEGHARA